MTKLFEYTDYREFLSHYYEEQKNLNKNFSYAVMAKKTNISSRGLLKLIIDGKRQLSLNNIGNMTTGLAFTKVEAEYFLTMVQFEQAKTSGDKNKFYERLMSFPQKRKISNLKREQYNLYSKWYFCFLYELVLLKKETQSFEEFCQWAATKAKDKLTIKEIKDAYEQLFALGLLITIDGQIKQTNKFIESHAKEEVSFAIQNFHREMMTRAAETVEQPIAKREFGAVTLAFNKNDLPRAKEFIRDFRNKFNLEFSANQGADSVYQLNIQFFELADGDKSISTDSQINLNSAMNNQMIENLELKNQNKMEIL
jgi:uncharacterized protein (TIGR02147 family)